MFVNKFRLEVESDGVSLSYERSHSLKTSLLGNFCTNLKLRDQQMHLLNNRMF